MSKVYIFSGLGADYRAFQKIDFNNLIVEHITWIEPYKAESIENYANRISSKITDENPILIGLSFGGILLLEIAKIKTSKRIILIASAKTKYELPKIYHLFGKLGLIRILPFSILTKPNQFLYWLFGIKSDEEKAIMKDILKDTDINFLKWAIKEISNWKNIEVPKNIIHIHGNKDRIIPIKNINFNYEIQNGGHLMTLNKSKEIEEILISIINNNQ